MDDGSEDETAAVAAAFVAADPRVSVISRPAHAADPGAARAAGAAAAGSPILWFLDADDVPRPDVAARIVDHFAAHPAVGSVVLSIRIVDADGKPVDGPEQWGAWWRPTRFGLRKMRPDERRVHPVSILGSACVISSALCCRRSAYETAGGWRAQSDRGFEDSDLALRLALSAPMDRLPEAVVDFRVHQSQFSATGSEALRRTGLHFLDRWREDATGLPTWRPAVDEAFAIYDRRVTPRLAWSAALGNLRAGQPRTAARFVIGALRIWVRSRARTLRR